MRDHGHGRAASRKALAIVLTLTAGFTVTEVVAGVLTGSLALLADAGHMLSDNVSIGLALFAVWLASRPPTPQRTFGFQRAEILAALANGVTLVAISIWVVVEAVERLREPTDVLAGWVLGVAAAGTAVNVAGAAILSRARGGSLNVEAAFRHVVADLLGSVAVIAAAGAMLLGAGPVADPAASLAIAVLIVVSSWTILRDSMRILLEAAPRGVNVREVGTAMASHPRVRDVHDLHVWTITSGFPALSAHVLVDPGADCHGIRLELERLLVERFRLEHTTLQVDHLGGKHVEFSRQLRG